MTYRHPYQPFWRDGPFTAEEDKILDELAAAHREVANRGNASGASFINSFVASGSYAQAVGGAMSTLGWPHGPIEDTYRFLQANDGVRGKWDMAPGWGSGFVKGESDPAFSYLVSALKQSALGMRILFKVTQCHCYVHSRWGKSPMLYPNASAWTAAVAIHIGLPAPLSPYLFVAARLPAWSKQAMEASR